MANEGNPGISKLAATLSDRMKQESSSPLVLDFGKINSNYSLQTNTFPIAIPKADYSVCRLLTLENAGSVMVTTNEAEGHQHNVTVPNTMKSLKPGDRVLVAWVQNEAVVIDVILPASSI